MNKKDKYELLKSQLKELNNPNIPLSGNICNMLAQVKKEFGHFWIGLYIRKEESLGLGPFQGEPACMEIKVGKGVCGSAAAQAKTIIVDDVNEYPGYIACHPEPVSEIVVPGFINGKVEFVLDVDSVNPANFDSVDAGHLEEITAFLAQIIGNRLTQL
jgi:L-methionine (R)-S-oxide reductase